MLLLLGAQPAKATGPDGFGYVSTDSITIGGISSQFFDISGTGTRLTFYNADPLARDGTLEPNPDDGVAIHLDLKTLNNGAGFPFYGRMFQEVNMSTNGFLHFELNKDSDLLTNSCPLQTTNQPFNMIAVLWDDLILKNPPSPGSGGFMQAFEVCPLAQVATGRCVIFQWNDVDHFSGGLDSFDFQAVLYERGEILLNYGPGDPEHGNGATVGLKNSDGTISLTHSCNTNNSVPDNFSILFRVEKPGTVNAEGQCVPGGTDCVYAELEPAACAGANGYLGQVNIASVINLQPADLEVTVNYFDAGGTLKGHVTKTLASNLKQDFIINDLGLQANSIGTVCIQTNAAGAGAWSGGVALYKPDFRKGVPAFGDKFDFALFFPFQNPSVGVTTVPLNTFHLGTNPKALVANWISIGDGEQGDGVGVKGTLDVLNSEGAIVKTIEVDIPDGGRQDFSGHDSLTNSSNASAVGLARFTGQGANRYLMTVTRYFYDCPGASCNNFLTAFNIPRRPPTAARIVGGGSTLRGEFAVLELNNIRKNVSTVSVSAYDSAGKKLGTSAVPVPPLGTRHFVLNKSGSDGLVSGQQSATATAQATSGSTSALSVFYKLDSAGVLQYAYAAPLVESPGQLQLSQFNTFISQTDEFEVSNGSGSDRSVKIDYVDYLGHNVFSGTFVVPAGGVKRLISADFKPPLPTDTYGTIIVQSDGPGISVRSYVIRDPQYTLPFPGE